MVTGAISASARGKIGEGPMPNLKQPRLVLAVPAWQQIRLAYEKWDVAEVEAQLKERLNKTPSSPSGLGGRNLAREFKVVALPSNTPIPDGLDIPSAQFRRMLVCGIVMTGGPDAAQALAASVHPAFGPEASVGADLAVSSAQNMDHWCPEEASYGLVGDRAAALRTIRADPALLAVEGVPGPERVNVVFVDTGLPPSLLPAAGFRGWAVLDDPLDPATTVRLPGNPVSGHGEMVARNARAVAAVAAPNPNVRLLDCPVIPDGITNLPVFLHSVTAALFSVWAVIEWLQSQDPKSPYTGWVICNAWGVFNPSLESPEAPYANNRGHPVSVALRLLDRLCADIVFAAGNCGQFCPNQRCHPDYTGPGRSINGANALDEVLTVGAVRIDRLWLGFSGQGPGIAGMAQEKPDLCAPSQFENEDDAGANTGTSASCGLAAGAVALLRTRWAPPPAGARQRPRAALDQRKVGGCLRTHPARSQAAEQ